MICYTQITMKKHLLFLLLLTCILAIVTGCSKNNDISGTGEPESFYIYGFLEECSDSAKYCTIQSFEVSSSCPVGDDVQSDGSGYYVILGLDTNLSVGELSDSNNQALLGLSGGQLIVLNPLTYDSENEMLIFEIPYIETLDYLQLCNLKVSNSESEFPFLSIIIEHFNKYCTIDGINYVGRHFKLILE